MMLARITKFGLLISLLAITTSCAEEISLQEKLNILQTSYPQKIAAISGRYLVLSNREHLLINDGKAKSHAVKLDHADIEDTLYQIYPLGPCTKEKPDLNSDPGRIRNDRLMRHLYGQSVAEVRSSLTAINWFGKVLYITTRHGVDIALTKVRDELGRLPLRYKKFFVETAGTFNWRLIAGTKRISVHSFGAAIDINIKFSDYWRWSGGKPGNVPRYKNKIPREIVEIFERHGFIWGGKWYHFDTMHFEYRPELIAIGRLVANRGCAK